MASSRSTKQIVISIVAWILSALMVLGGVASLLVGTFVLLGERFDENNSWVGLDDMLRDGEFQALLWLAGIMVVMGLIWPTYEMVRVVHLRGS